MCFWMRQHDVTRGRKSTPTGQRPPPDQTHYRFGQFPHASEHLSEVRG